MNRTSKLKASITYIIKNVSFVRNVITAATYITMLEQIHLQDTKIKLKFTFSGELSTGPLTKLSCNKPIHELIVTRGHLPIVILGYVGLS